jgi:hypothetical protein
MAHRNGAEMAAIDFTGALLGMLAGLAFLLALGAVAYFFERRKK